MTGVVAVWILFVGIVDGQHHPRKQPQKVPTARPSEMRFGGGDRRLEYPWEAL
jgi:hypothetical protein